MNFNGGICSPYSCRPPGGGGGGGGGSGFKITSSGVFYGDRSNFPGCHNIN